VQPNACSIQELIERSLQTYLKEPIRVIGAGRTDAGVHALAQMAHFGTELSFSCAQLQRALNGMLPHDIRILDCSATDDTFHAQYSALSKEYHYHLWLEPTLTPFCRLYRHHFCYQNFSRALLEEAAKLFVGTHDFTTFANVGGSTKSAIRTIYRIDVVEQEGGLRLEFEGNGFLYKMVRNIVGTLLEISIQKRELGQIKQLFAAKKRTQAGRAAPAKGLFLVQVNY